MIAARLVAWARDAEWQSGRRDGFWCARACRSAVLGRAGVDIGMGMGSGRIKCVLAITKGTLSGVMAAGRLSGYSG
jgi:hypothetical protein